MSMLSVWLIGDLQNAVLLVESVRHNQLHDHAQVS
jgi:hypothetical protein